MAYNVLVAEDEKSVREFISDDLGDIYSNNIVIYEASDGLEALKVISEKSIDLLITDINMPGKTGLEVIAEAQKISPETKYLILSGRVVEYREKADQLGVEIIGKPFNILSFEATVAKYLPLPQK